MNCDLFDRKLATFPVNFTGFFLSVRVVTLIVGFCKLWVCLCSTETNKENVVKVAVIEVNNLKISSSILNQ